ncbi:MAG: hypothetical protein PSV35_08415 [bacterium]|nr:hypothetical protein [bacterium]
MKLLKALINRLLHRAQLLLSFLILAPQKWLDKSRSKHRFNAKQQNSLLIKINQKVSSDWAHIHQQREMLLVREHITLNGQHFKPEMDINAANAGSFGEQIIHLFNPTNSTAFEDPIINQLDSLVQKGTQWQKEIKHSLVTQLKEQLSPYISQSDLDDFINQTDALSLQVEHITISVNQLMSCYEIH